MAKDRICRGCEHNNNGWCKALKTNKISPSLTDCENRKDSKIGLINGFITSKTYEYKVNPSEKLKGEIDGLKLALSVMEV